MLITFVDEVKLQKKNKQPVFWYGGVCLHVKHISKLIKQLSDLAQKFYKTRRFSTETEFHASDIFNSKMTLLDNEALENVELLKELADLFKQTDLLQTICVAVVPEQELEEHKLYELAFPRLLQQVGDLYKELNSAGIIIMDNERKSVVRQYEEILSSYREGGERSGTSLTVDNILETVYFAESHHSRLLQLTDCFSWFCQFIFRMRRLQVHNKDLPHIAADLYQYIQKIEKIANPDMQDTDDLNLIIDHGSF